MSADTHTADGIVSYIEERMVALSDSVEKVSEFDAFAPIDGDGLDAEAERRFAFLPTRGPIRDAETGIGCNRHILEGELLIVYDVTPASVRRMLKDNRAVRDELEQLRRTDGIERVTFEPLPYDYGLVEGRVVMGFALVVYYWET